MHTTSAIVIHAPRERVFDCVAALERWPDRLPHYRSIRFLDRQPGHAVVRMAADRDGLPVAWTSEFVADRDRFELRFTHLRAWTKGMKVVWRFHPEPGGATRAEIVHDLAFRWRPLAPLAEWIIGEFFIANIAAKTLRAFKAYLEADPPPAPTPAPAP